MNLLTAAPHDRKALAELKRLGFADPRAALVNLHALTPEPRDAELLTPLLPRLLRALAESPDPDMALNNLERLAAQGDRVALFRLLGAHPGALHLVARLGGTSQFLADTLRRHPTLFPWLLEGQTMRQWHGDELAAALEQTTSAFERIGPRPSQTARSGASASLTSQWTLKLVPAMCRHCTSSEPRRSSPCGASFRSLWIETQSRRQ